MKILMVSPFIPFPPDSGGKVRVYNILEHLRKYHRVDFVAPSFGDRIPASHPDDHIIDLPRIRTTRKICSLLTLAPYHAALVEDRRIDAYIQDLMKKQSYDLIYLHYIYSMQYIPAQVESPIVVDPQNVDRELWFRKFHNRANSLPFRLFSLINAYKTMWFEKRYLKRVRAYVSVSEQDLADTKAYAHRFVDNFLVVPNGMNISSTSAKRRRGTQPGRIVLGFLGSLDLSINQQAVQELCFEILPHVRSALSGWDVRLLVVGKNPPRRITSLGEVDRQIQVFGSVPEVSDYLYQMDIMVLPLREGGGSKLRVLEAMATGLPIIGTSLAFIGINGLKHDENCYYANTNDELTQAICNLARNPARRRKIGLQARKLALSKYQWEKIVRNLSEDLRAVSLSSSVPSRAPVHAHSFL